MLFTFFSHWFSSRSLLVRLKRPYFLGTKCFSPMMGIKYLKKRCVSATVILLQGFVIRFRFFTKRIVCLPLYPFFNIRSPISDRCADFDIRDLVDILWSPYFQSLLFHIQIIGDFLRLHNLIHVIFSFFKKLKNYQHVLLTKKIWRIRTLPLKIRFSPSKNR